MSGLQSDLKFMKISRFYPGFLKSYYTANSWVRDRPYTDQYNHLMGQGFGWSDYLSRELSLLGYECMDVVANAGPLQAAWAQEHGLRLGGAPLVLEQIKSFRPDILLVQDTVTLDALWCARVREFVPSLRLLVGWHCAPYSTSDQDLFRQFDLLLTCNPRLVDEFSALGATSHLMGHGFEPSLYDAIVAGEGSKDGRERATHGADQVLFAGSITLGSGFHQGRLKFLETLYESGIPLFIRSEKPSTLKTVAKSTVGGVARALAHLPLSRGLQQRSFFSRALQWQGLGTQKATRKRLAPIWAEPLYAKELLAAISGATINLNFHIDSAGEYAGNARLFEVTGMGSCLVTDHKKNLATLFDPDYEVVSYKTVDECIEKIKWLLAHPKERAAIAEAGRRRCHKDHSFKVRAEQLNELIISRLNA